MKRFLPLFIVALALSSCQEDVKFNNPGFQGQKDEVFWRANDARAYVDASGRLRIEALTQYEIVTLNTASANEGTYVLGTADLNSSASYSSSFNDILLEYATTPIAGPVNSVILMDAGSGYFSDCTIPAGQTTYSCSTSHETTSGVGGGSGLKVAIVANASGNVTKVVRVTARGNGYTPGDVVTVAQGNVNSKLKILNTVGSNGEIEITEYDQENFTVSGKFKFNAASSNDNPIGGPILNFQYGEFYQIPIYPSEGKR